MTAALIAATITPSHAAEIWSAPRQLGLGGTFIYIKGVINQGDEKKFALIAKNVPRPIYVYPSGPGGDIEAALLIGNMISEWRFTTVVGNGYLCGSSCALIWASGYSGHAIAQSQAQIRFHSCSVNGQDDLECNDYVMRFLMKWGFTAEQARWAVLASNGSSILATQKLAYNLGFRWQSVSSKYAGWGDRCQYRLCIVYP